MKDIFLNIFNEFFELKESDFGLVSFEKRLVYFSFELQEDNLTRIYEGNPNRATYSNFRVPEINPDQFIYINFLSKNNIMSSLNTANKKMPDRFERILSNINNIDRDIYKILLLKH